MSQPTPSPKPEQDSVEEPELDEGAAEAELPLNRADRRARAKSGNPSHVGPQAGRSDQGRGPRSHTKRQLS